MIDHLIFSLQRRGEENRIEGEEWKGGKKEEIIRKQESQERGNMNNKQGISSDKKRREEICGTSERGKMKRMSKT